MSSSGNSALDRASNDANQTMSPAPAGSPAQSCGDAPSPDSPVSPQKKSWIAIELVDEFGKSIPYEDYSVALPDGTVVEGTLDKHGRARINGIDPGNCKVSFTERDGKEWKRQ